MLKLPVSAGALLLLGVTLFACEDEDKHPSNVVVQFTTSSLEITENDDEHMVLLNLSSPLTSASEFKIKVEPAHLITTEPVAVAGVVTVPVPRGSRTASFKLKSITNNTDNPDQQVSINLMSLAAPLIAGDKSTFKVTIKDDDDAPAPTSVANFLNNGATITENDQAGVEYVIQLSTPAASAGTITIGVNAGSGVYARHFLSQPAINDGKLVLDVAQGQATVSFRVSSIENAEATGQLDLVFSINETTGNIVRGERTDETLTIVDDELLGKPKGYNNSNSVDSYATMYEYDIQGRITKRNWVSHTPYKQSGTDEYFYNNANQVIKIRKHAYKEIVFTWSGDRIIKSEEVQEGVVKSYTDYGYDDAGNVGLVAPYYRQNNGEYKAGLFFVYLYFNDGNVYKQLTYNPLEDAEAEPVLVSTKTYDNYLDVANPFPMVEILPGIKSQRKLATTYVVEENGTTQTYHITYEFREDGQPAKRHTTGAGNAQIVDYQYY
jgi:hypothetical protein